MKPVIRTLFCLAALNISWLLHAQVSDFSNAELMVSEKISSEVRSTFTRVLQEELSKRTSLKVPVVITPGRRPLIVLVRNDENEIKGIKIPFRKGEDLPESRHEGFRIVLEKQGEKDILWLIGADDRAILFAVGHFLRSAGLSKGKILLTKKIEIATSPAYSIRGHQLGYRNTANSWDAWTVPEYEQYIRELALFGSNCIENIPFQDGPPGPNMKVPVDEMNLSLSKICASYGLDYWVWTPANVDLSDESKLIEEIRKHSEFYRSCPKLDAVFIPGGDPGNNHPRYLLPFLEKLSVELKKYHPSAGIWISLQGFSDDENEYFFEYLGKNNPDWLEGVVSGPGSPDIAAERYRLPERYKHRHYADITHSVRCQYPVENWDQAFALTEGREVSNPQPFFYARIHNDYAPSTDGFLSYSDGVHDDVNKIVWNQLGWDPQKNVREILVEYSRFFFGPVVAESSADGILALERNWVGPVEENGGIETTFYFWQNLEKSHPELRDNWRWQLLVMRAYYDTYIRRRKIYEQELEKEANRVLSTAEASGSVPAMDKALSIVNKADEERISPELRKKIVDYCEMLFRSVGLQTSVNKYNASGAERGAVLDFVDYPLNNRWWLADEFQKIKLMPSEKDRLARLEIIYKWEDPGPGSYYDNVSDISKSPRVKTRSYDATDVAWWDNGMSRRRLSTQLFQNFPVLDYHGLDPGGSYTVRISGFGDALLRIDGERIEPVVYNKGLEEFKEFRVARKYVSDGAITISFDEPEESHLNWRQQSKICDIWLLKDKPSPLN